MAVVVAKEELVIVSKKVLDVVAAVVGSHVLKKGVMRQLGGVPGMDFV